MKPCFDAGSPLNRCSKEEKILGISSWDSLSWYGSLTNGDTWIHPPVIANLDPEADPSLEILIATGGNTKAHARGATILAYEPFSICSPRMVGRDFLPDPRTPQLSLNHNNTTPVVADLDANGKYEIVVGGDNFGLYMWEEDYFSCSFPTPCAMCPSGHDAARVEPGWPLL